MTDLLQWKEYAYRLMYTANYTTVQCVHGSELYLFQTECLFYI